MKERNVGIDILKFFAVLFITNSHMGVMYGKYSALATGGTIGDVLFFFCSGFTLFLKPIDSLREFPNWYKRRINRIYPTVFAMAILLRLYFNEHADIVSIILYGGGWFVTCIMVYYVFIYFIGLYCKEKISWVIAAVSLGIIAWFFMIERPFPFTMYSDESIHMKWVLYFAFMLLGAKMALDGTHRQAGHQTRNLIITLAGFAAFYLIYASSIRIERLEFIQVFNFLPLLPAVYFFLLWGNGNFAKKLYRNKVANFIIRFVGGLCLEVYFMQYAVFAVVGDKWNFMFPFNIPIAFCVIVLAAYLLRCFARLLSQTFKDEPYNWKKMISVY